MIALRHFRPPGKAIVRERRRMCTRKERCAACTSTGEPKCQTPGAAAVCPPPQEMPSACSHLSFSALCVCSCYMFRILYQTFILSLGRQAANIAQIAARRVQPARCLAHFASPLPVR
jgi:hypothetical protein